MIREGFVRLIRWAKSQTTMADDQNELLNECVSLSPLTPQYLEAEHAIYGQVLWSGVIVLCPSEWVMR